jgi:hypothetical protein
MKQYMQTLATAFQFLMQMNNQGGAAPATTASPASSPSPAATQH